MRTAATDTVYGHLTRILDFSAQAGGGAPDLQGSAGRLERLPEPGRRRKRHGELSARLGTGKLCCSWRTAGWAERRTRSATKAVAAQASRTPVKASCGTANGISAASPTTGRKIGTQQDTEGKVHMESNTWAVLSGAAGRSEGVRAMDSVDEYLYTPWGLMLNAPSLYRSRTMTSALSPASIPA